MLRTVQSLAVVPVAINAGAALLPALIAGAGSAISLLFRPRALLHAVRQRPLLAASALIVIALAGAGGYFFWLARGAAAAPPPPAAIDWPAIARQLQEELRIPHALLVPLWTNRLEEDMALATPAVFSDPAAPVLYQPSVHMAVDKLTGAMHALDPRTGQTLWSASRFTAADGSSGPIEFRAIFSQPAVAAGGQRLITGQGLHDDANCAFVCIDISATIRAADSIARAAWAVPTTLHLESSPALFTANGRECVVIGAGAIEGPDKKPLTHPGYALCVDVASGKLLWTYDVADPEAVPVVDKTQHIYIGSGVNGNAVVALRSEPEELLRTRSTSRLLWRTATPYAATGDLALAHDQDLGDLLILGAGNGDYIRSDPQPAGLVLALDPATGHIRWQTPLPDSVLGRLCVAGKVLLAPCRDGRAYALDLATGRPLWNTVISESNAVPLLSGLVTDKRYAFALAADATLAVLDLDTGKIIERRKLSDPAKISQNYTMAAPLLVEKVLYVPTETTGLHAFRITW